MNLNSFLHSAVFYKSGLFHTHNIFFNYSMQMRKGEEKIRPNKAHSD